MIHLTTLALLSFGAGAVHLVMVPQHAQEATRAIERGFQQREIQQAAYTHQQAIESGERVLVGVNRFQSKEVYPIELLKLDPKIEKRQKEKLARKAAKAQSSKTQPIETPKNNSSKHREGKQQNKGGHGGNRR